MLVNTKLLQDNVTGYCKAGDIYDHMRDLWLAACETTVSHYYSRVARSNRLPRPSLPVRDHLQESIYAN